MVSDSIPNASITMHKDFPKKKRANRSAKLKQCKLDARREQWLSQVKNKGSKEEVNIGANQGPANERGRLIEKLEIKPRGKEDHEVNNDSINHYSDSDLDSNSPIGSIMEGNDFGANYAGSSSSSSSGSSISSCSGSGGCCSKSLSEEDDDCMDDWEAVADALAATDQKLEQHHTGERDENFHLSSNWVTGNDTTKKSEPIGLASRPPVSCKAWRRDDAFRPQVLPNLTKQYSFPMNSERHFRGGAVWGGKRLSVPTSCPICCEDLDVTDTSFLPCTCGFVLCLFCHKRILEEDGRCPGCRKQYNHESVEADGGSLKFRLARSCSMISRS